MTQTPESVLVTHGFRPHLTPDAEEDFLRACHEGLDDVVRAWLAIGMSPNVKAPHSLETPLIKAAEGGHISTIDILFDAGADPDLRDSSDDTALPTSLNWNHPEVARHLAKRGLDVNIASQYGECALEKAIAEDHDDHIPVLLELGANANFADQGRSPMRTAIENERTDIIEKLLEHGATPDLVLDVQGIALNRGITALQFAIKQRSEAVDIFLEHDASLALQDAFGLTALDYALLSFDEDTVSKLTDRGQQPSPLQAARAAVWQMILDGDVDGAIQMLIQKDLPIDIRNASHKTPLMHCSELGDAESVRKLLDVGANAGLFERDYSAVYYALSSESDSNPEVLSLLLAKNPPLFDRKGDLAGFSSAVWYGNTDAAKLLLSRCSPEECKRLGHHLRAAVMQRNAQMVQLLIESGVPLNEPNDIGGDTPIMDAVSSYHDREVVDVMLKAGADLSLSKHRNATSPLHKILTHYQWDQSYEPTLIALLEYGAPLDVVDWLGLTPCSAADKKKGQLETLVRYLVTDPLARGESIADLAKRHSWATLCLFVDAGKSDLIQELIAHEVAIDPPAAIKADSVLHYAVEKQDIGLVKTLLNKGANPNRRNHYDMTPFSIAVGKPSLEIVEALLAAGADVNQRVWRGDSVVNSAIAFPQHLDLLKEKGAPFDDKINGPLLSAVWSKVTVDAQKLIAYGADPNTTDNYGRTPLVFAITQDKLELAAQLIEAGAHVDQKDRQTGDAPLHIAAKKGNVQLINTLLAKGASLEVQNKDGDDVIALIQRRSELRTQFADLLATRGIGLASSKLAPLDSSLTQASPAWIAVYQGDLTAILAATEDGSLGVNDQDPWGTTPLMAAVLLRDYDLIESILDKGGDPDMEDCDGAIATDYLGFLGDPEINRLIAKYAKPQEPSMDRLNAQAARAMAQGDLDRAISSGDIHQIAKLIAQKRVHPFLCFDGESLMTKLNAKGDQDLIDSGIELGLSV